MRTPALWTLAAGLTLLCISCARSSLQDPRPLPPPPAAAPPVAPAVTRVRETLATTGRDAAVLQHAAADLSRAAADATREAARLAGKQTATPDELNGLWKSLQSLEARNLFLESETTRLTGNLQDLAGQLVILQQTAADRDAEATQLRDQLAFAHAEKSRDSAAIDRARHDTLTQRTRADRLTGEIIIYRIILGILLALILIWILIRLLLPIRR